MKNKKEAWQRRRRASYVFIEKEKRRIYEEIVFLRAVLK